jgi:hypothetical protein
MAPAQAARITKAKPGMTRKAKPAPLANMHNMTFVNVFVESATKMGSAASVGVIFPALTKVAIEIVAGSILAKPATAAAATTPGAPNHSFMAVEASKTPLSIAAKKNAVVRLNARPRSSTSSERSRKARIVKTGFPD